VPRYLLNRLFQTVQVLLVISLVVFLLIYLIPGDPASVILGDNYTEAAYNALRTELGLDQPLPAQFLTWLGHLLTGDLGYSYFLNDDVASILMSRFVPTLQLATLALIIALVISVPLGIAAGMRTGGPNDKLLTVVALLGIAVPGFVLSLFLIQLFSLQLKILPVSGYVDPFRNFGDSIRHLIMPAFALAIVQASFIARITRAAVADVVGSGFIKTARAKGVGERRLTYHHVLRNALLPILTVTAHSFGTLLAGAVVIETIFNIPGIGQLLVSSIGKRDYQVIQGAVLLTAFLYVAINLMVDIMYSAIDPRVRLATKGANT
jgi:peptide/nickel transport system permease protein